MNRKSLEGMSIIGSPQAMGGRFQLALVLLILAFCAMFMGNAMAAPPPAGSVIGNQATATYKDTGGTTRNTTSNLVETTVTQVYAIDIQQDQIKFGAPGQTVYLPHTVVNNGNGTDSVSLDLTQLLGPSGTDDFDFSTAVIYADDNGDGVPDNTTPITSLSNIPGGGGSKKIVIAVQVPGTATAGTQAQVNIKATSLGDPATVKATDNNTDTVKVNNDANIPVTKSQDKQSGNVGDTVVFTLSYTNNGSKTATNLVLTDNLDADYEYIAGSGIWSDSATGLTDAAGGDPAGIDYAASGQTVTGSISSVAPGKSGYLRFSAKVRPGATGTIPNRATVSYNNGSTSVNDTTNETTFDVKAAAAVEISDDTSPSNDGLTGNRSTTDDDGNFADDIVTESSPAAQGSSVIFDNVVRNNGTATDTFDITVSNTSFPTGTSFQLLRADDTPMTDSNGNGIPDTGPLAPGATFHVHMRAQLPSGASGAGPFEAIKTAKSTNDPTQSDTVIDRLLEITANTVNVTNDAAVGQPGAKDAGATDAPANTNEVNPGQSTSFVLFVNNTSTVADSYDLLAGATGSPSFVAGGFPAGWTVVFHKGDATGPVITNTDTIPAGGSVKVTAVVTVPAGQKPITQDVFFQAKSPTSGAVDVKHDAVKVKDVTDVSVTPNNTGTAYPGGTVVYSHTLTNNGNTDVSSGPLTNTDSLPGWSSVLYYDKNGNGVGDADEVVDDIADIVALDGNALIPGESKPLLVKVFVPAGAPDGAQNDTTVTAAAPGDTVSSNDKAIDSTKVVVGDVDLLKEQALDENCNNLLGDPNDTAFTTADQAAKPGQCLAYRITLTNLGGEPITDAKISDFTPSFTVYNGGVAVTNSSTDPAVVNSSSTPAAGTAGTVSGSYSKVDPNGKTTLIFFVKIDQ